MSFVFLLVLFGIFAKSETCNVDWFHNVFVNEFIVGHSRNFFDDTPKEEIADV